MDLFFSFSLQSQMCQKKEHFYHCCQKQDANNLPPSNTSVLFTREQHTKGSRSLSTTQCMEVQRPNYLHPIRAGQAVLCFIRTVVLLMEKKKKTISWFLSAFGDIKNHSPRKNRTHVVKYFHSCQASKPGSQRNWSNH